MSVCKAATSFLASLGVLLLAACAGEEAPPQAGPPEVTVVTLRTEPVILTRELPGRVQEVRVAEVRPQVDGIIRERLFAEGSMVEAGQSLYQLDDAIYRAELASAEAARARARAQLHIAELNARRAEKLVRTGAISSEEYDNATANHQAAQAEVAVAEASVRHQQILLNYSRIEAPINGYIGRSRVTEGALLTASQPEALAVIRQLDPVYVDVNQSSQELLALRRQIAAGELDAADARAVTILLEDGSTYLWPGELSFTDMSVDPGTGAALLRIQVPNPERLLLPGMYVRAEVPVGRRVDGLLVPQRAVSRDPKGVASAMVVGDDGIVEARTLSLVQAIGDRWLVSSGLAPGEQVVVAGLQRIRAGMPVRVRALETDVTAPARNRSVQP